MKKLCLLVLLNFLVCSAFTQNNEQDKDQEVIGTPFSIVENVPIYPGCEKGENSEKRDCTQKKIAAFVNKNYNTKIAKELGLSGRQRIHVIFKIDVTGNIVGARARAPHNELEQEAVRVINLLPKMKPGKHKGKAVIVPYSLPIMFQVQD